MDKLTVGTATCISSSLHVDAADVAVPRRIVLCVPGIYSGPRERSVRGATAFYDAGKACELLLLSHLPLLSASSEHPTCTQQQMHFASATGSRISITSSSSSSRCRGAASAEAAPSTAAVTTKTCWLSFRWDSFLQTERKYVKCKCISVGSVFCFKATITRNRAARQMRRQLHESPPGTTFMPDNVEIRCEFSLHICLSLSLSVYVCVWSGQVLNGRIAYDNRILLVSRAVRKLHNCRLAGVTSAILTVWGKLSGSSVIPANVVIIYLTGLPTYLEISFWICPCLCYI